MSEHSNQIITDEVLRNLISCSLDQLYKNDKYLIDNRPYYQESNGNHYVGERSIVFRLAHYMQNIMDSTNLFDSYILDCEYNRNGIHAKELPSFPNGVYPDIIIHQRGNNEHNLLVMEIKTYWNRNNLHDIEKIKEFLDIDGKYHFRFGNSLVIEKRRTDAKVELLCANNSDL